MIPDSQRTIEGRPTSDENARAQDTIARSFLALGAGEMSARVIAFLATLLLARRLGAEGLGVVSLAAAILLYLSRAVDAGFDLGIGVREASVRRTALEEFIPPVLAFRLALAVPLIMIAGSAAMAFLPRPEGPVVALYCLTLIPVALSVRWALTGIDRTFAVGVARAVGELVVFVTVALAVHGATDVWRVPLAQLLGDTLGTVILVLGLRRLAIRVRVRWNSATLQPLVRHMAPYVGSTLLGIALFNADILFLRMFRDAATVGLYAAAYALLSFVINIGGTYAVTLMPSFTRLAGDTATRQEVFEQAAAKVFLVVLPITIGGGMIGAQILATVYSEEFAPAGPVLAVLLVSAPFSLLRAVATAGIVSERREDALFRIVGVSATVNVVLNLLVVPKWGMMGAAMVTVATEVLRLVLSQRQAMNLGFALPPFSRAAKAMIAAFVMGLVLSTPIARNPWLAIPAGAAAYGVVLLVTGALRIRRGALPELRV